MFATLMREVENRARRHGQEILSVSTFPEKFAKNVCVAAINEVKVIRFSDKIR